MAQKKMRRMVAKAAAALSLRRLTDILQLNEDAWSNGAIPIRLITVKTSILDYLSRESSDIDRASFWMAVRETQRPIDKGRTLSFPIGWQGSSYMDRS